MGMMTKSDDLMTINMILIGRIDEWHLSFYNVSTLIQIY